MSLLSRLVHLINPHWIKLSIFLKKNILLTTNLVGYMTLNNFVQLLTWSCKAVEFSLVTKKRYTSLYGTSLQPQPKVIVFVKSLHICHLQRHTAICWAHTTKYRGSSAGLWLLGILSWFLLLIYSEFLPPLLSQLHVCAFFKQTLLFFLENQVVFFLVVHNMDFLE